MENLELGLLKLAKIGENNFNGVEKFGESITCEEIMDLMRVVAMEERSAEVVERIEEKDIRNIYNSLLSITLSNWHQIKKQNKNVSLSAHEMRKSRIALRCLVNLVQRSEKFCGKIAVDSMDHLECLLAVEGIEKEVVMLLCKTSNSSYIEFQKSTRYSEFLSKVVDVFYRTESKEVESLALAYFSTLLEKDYALLANCYAEMEEYQFLQFLTIVETLMSDKHTKSVVHSNNLHFILNLLELICDQYDSYQNAQVKRRSNSRKLRRKWTADVVKSLIGIVGEMCSTQGMSSHLNDKIHSIIDILDAALHSEALFASYRQTMGPEYPEIENVDSEIGKAIKEEKRIAMSRKKQLDRPEKVGPGRILRVERSDSLRALSDVFLECYKDVKIDYGVMGELKLNCLKVIAKLCGAFPSNKKASTENGRIGILSVLQCTAPRPLWFLESYAIQKWAIFCVRQLTDDCQENAEVILNLDQPSQPIVDRERLLKEFGLQSIIDEKTGIKKLIRIDEEQFSCDE